MLRGKVINLRPGASLGQGGSTAQCAEEAFLGPGHREPPLMQTRPAVNLASPVPGCLWM